MRRSGPATECAVVRLVLERERTLDGLERLLGSGAVAAIKALAADGVVIRHGELLWASPALSRLAELGWSFSPPDGLVTSCYNGSI
jgi:hypothetical protein